MHIHKHLKKYNDGAIHYVTTRTFESIPYFKDEECCAILIKQINYYRKKYGFLLPGYVIMPDHIHILIHWDVEKNKSLTISKIMNGIKGYSARIIIKHLNSIGKSPPICKSGKNKPHRRKWERKIWQDGYYDFNIGSEKKFLEKLEYMHNNPFKCDEIAKPERYRFSSREWYETRKGIIEVDPLW